MFSNQKEGTKCLCYIAIIIIYNSITKEEKNYAYYNTIIEYPAIKTDNIRLCYDNEKGWGLGIPLN